MSNWAHFPLEQLELRGDLVWGPQCGDPHGETRCGAGLAGRKGKWSARCCSWPLTWSALVSVVQGCGLTPFSRILLVPSYA